MDVLWTTKAFIQSKILSWCETGNPMIDGLLSAVILSVVAYASTSIMNKYYYYLDRASNLCWLRKKENSIEIEETSGYGQNEAYLDFCWFITHQQPCRKGSLRAIQYIKSTYCDDDTSSSTERMSFFVPREGIMHDFVFEDTSIRYQFWKIAREDRGDKKGLTIYHSGSDCEVLYRFVKHIEKARQEWISSHTWMQTVYSNKEGEWIGMPSHNSKAMSTVVLSGNTSRDIEEDLKRFLESEDWYKQMGIAFTRGYLLHGPPGCGKTSIIKAMSYKLKMDIYNINLAVVKDDDQLKSLFDKVPVKSMVVLEDIDCMSDIAHARTSTCNVSTEVSSGKAPIQMPMMQTGPTLSCLLNALDGLSPPHGRVLVLTSNHPEKLDAALTRPGRIDMIVALGMCSEDIVIKLYNLYYKKSLDDDTISILADAVCHKLSPADVSSIFLKHRHDSKLGIEEVLGRMQSS